jgi:hypothetical protein
LGFILPRVFPSADAARPDAVPSALELRAGSLPCGSAPSPLHGVLTFGGSGVFSLENANPSEVPPLDRLADLEPFDRAGLLIPRNPENRLPDSPARLLLHDRRSYRSSTAWYRGIRSLVPKGSRVGPLSDSVALPPLPTTPTPVDPLFVVVTVSILHTYRTGLCAARGTRPTLRCPVLRREPSDLG